MGNVQKELSINCVFTKNTIEQFFFTEIRDASLYSYSFNFTMKQKKNRKVN